MKYLRFRQSLARVIVAIVAAVFLSAFGIGDTLRAEEPAQEPAWGRVPQAIVVRTTENVTQGGWVWLLNRAKEVGIGRIYLLVKQDENQYVSARTGQTLSSGELLVSLPGETTVAGWENSDWLVEMLARANTLGIEVFAWWPLFQDAVMAKDFPNDVYAGEGNDQFVDPAIEGVRERQEKLLGKLIATYPFDGVALDWIRYNERDGGSRGPLADRFAEITGKPWSAELMKQPLERAIWDDLRAGVVADWVATVIANSRQQHPQVKWGAFVLPWQFKEVAQSYRKLGQVGLDDLQPMIYWADWNESPDFVSDVLRGGPFWLSGATEFRPTLDLNVEDADLIAGLSDLSAYRLGGLTWYLHGSWGEQDFARLQGLAQKWSEVAPVLGENADDVYLDPPPPPPTRQGLRLEPAQFAPDANLWSLVCLAALYERGALDNSDPVVPVLTMHRFVDGDFGSGTTDWYNSTAYLDELMNFLDKHHFSVVPLSSVEAYMISEDPTVLPERPVALTIDDGSETILKYFQPRAAAHGFPYAVSLITSLVKPEGERGSYEDEDEPDAVLTPTEIKTLADSKLVTFPSHTHDLHFWGPTSDDEDDDEGPAMTTRLWLKDLDRREGQDEWAKRVLSGLVRSRQAIADLGVGVPRVLTWPYGEFNATTEKLAQTAGFTSFLLFAEPAFAAPRSSTTEIPRVSVMRADEAITLEMPDDPLIQQRWWLAFLARARMTGSIPLIEASLEQLDDAQRDHPEAELSRALVEALRGYSVEAALRIKTLREDYPHDAAVHHAIDETVNDFKELF